MIKIYSANDRAYVSVYEVLNDNLPGGTLYMTARDELYVKIVPNALVKINREDGRMYKLHEVDVAGLKLRPAPKGFVVKITQDDWRSSTYDRVEK